MKECDCEYCPLSWEDRSYEGECEDCGCMAYGDYLGGAKFLCRLPDFIKRKIAKCKQSRIDKQQAHQYEGIGEWYAEEQRKTTAMRQALGEKLFENLYGEELYLCFEHDGKLYKYGEGRCISREQAYEIRCRYEELLENSDESEETE